MFATGAVLLPFFSLMSFLIAVPTGVKFFNWHAPPLRRLPPRRRLHPCSTPSPRWAPRCSGSPRCRSSTTWTARYGQRVLDEDPWGFGRSLEWATFCPPALFLRVQYRRRGPRPEDRPDAGVADAAGPVGFLPPPSLCPITVAAGFTVLCLGVVYGRWLFLLGLGLVSHGAFGMVLRYANRSTDS
jgi:hypothetical protein